MASAWLHTVEVNLGGYNGPVQISGTDANRVWAEAAALVAAVAAQGGLSGYRLEIHHVRTSEILL